MFHILVIDDDKNTRRLMRAVLEGDVETGSVMSGQVAGMLHEIRPVAEIFRDLYESGIARTKATAAEWSDAE